MHGERYDRRVAGPGHGAKTGVAVMEDEDVTTLKVASREKKPGTCPSLRCLMWWSTVFLEMEKRCKGRRGRSLKGWGAGGETATFFSREVCP